MNIDKTRSWLYRIARILSDVNAIKKGRIARRAAGKVAGRMLGKLFK